MKKLLVFAFALSAIFCILTMTVFAAEPSSSNEFGEVTLITDNDGLNNKNDCGYSEGDTARVVLQIPGTETYITYPAYYVLDLINKDGGIQGVENFSYINAATGYEFDATSIIRLEFPNVVEKFSSNYFHIGDMTNIKYVKFGSNMDTVFGFARNASVETVVFEDNTDTDATLSLAKNAFENCSSLTTIDLPVHLTSIGERAFASTPITTIELSSKLEVIGTAAFLSCAQLQTVVIPGDNSIKEIAHRAFDDCYSLSMDFNLSKLTTVGSIAFRNAGKNEGCYINLNFPAIVSIGQQAFLNAGVRSLSLSSTFKYESGNWNTFMGCKKLEYADLSMCTVEAYPACFFSGCTSLKVVLLNDSLKTLGKQMFADCTSLEFLYLPTGLESLGVGDNYAQGAFYNCTSLYFVKDKYSLESFVTDGAFDATKYAQNKPARADVYFFPTTIKDLDNVANPFRNCKNINPTIVFGENTVLIHNGGHTFASIGTAESPKNVVFLGNVTNFYYNNTYANISFYMVGSSKDTFVINDGNSGNENARVYLCGESGYYNLHWAGSKMDWKETDTPAHIKEKSEATDATCENPAMVADYCFCGTIMGEPVTDGEALGHSHTIDQGCVYENYMAQGYISMKCDRCEDVSTDTKVDALFTSIGVSAKTFGDDIGLVQGYALNRAAIEAYKVYAPDFDFGILAYANRTEGAQAVTPKPGDDKVVDIVFDNMANDFIEVKLIGVPDEFKNVPLIFCVYATQGGKFFYLDDGVMSESIVGKSYNEIVG